VRRATITPAGLRHAPIMTPDDGVSTDAQQNRQYRRGPDGRFLINTVLDIAAAPITSDESESRDEEVAPRLFTPHMSPSVEESVAARQIVPAASHRNYLVRPLSRLYNQRLASYTRHASRPLRNPLRPRRRWNG
jgi:hypothetical protein